MIYDTPCFHHASDNINNSGSGTIIDGDNDIIMVVEKDASSFFFDKPVVVCAPRGVCVVADEESAI